MSLFSNDKNEDKLFDWNEAKEDQERFKTSNTMVIIGWGLLTVVTVIIVGASVYMAIMGMPLDETLKTWGGTVLGFLFGSFVTIVREFMSDRNISNNK